MWLTDFVPIHLFELSYCYFLTYDAEQTFFARVKNARTGISKLDVANNRSKFFW